MKVIIIFSNNFFIICITNVPTAFIALKYNYMKVICILFQSTYKSKNTEFNNINKNRTLKAGMIINIERPVYYINYVI